MPKLLSFVAKNDPILREVMPIVSDFNDCGLQEIIQDMCYSIEPEQIKAASGAFESAAGMAANQWGIKKRVFIFTPQGSDKPGQREVMINPCYTPYLEHKQKTPKMSAAFEGCFSVPLATGLVNRYEAIIATWYTAQGKKMQRIMKDWEARVFQHETDHLDGKLYDGVLDNYAGPECLQRHEFKDKKEMEAFWEKMRGGEGV